LKQIKFDQIYNKLNSIDISQPVKLIDCFHLGLNTLPYEFIKYDTAYIQNGKELNYPLDDMEYILLFFMDCKGSLFTTLRKATPENDEYYSTSIGSMFEVVIVK